MRGVRRVRGVRGVRGALGVGRGAWKAWGRGGRGACRLSEAHMRLRDEVNSLIARMSSACSLPVIRGAAG